MFIKVNMWKGNLMDLESFFGVIINIIKDCLKMGWETAKGFGSQILMWKILINMKDYLLMIKKKGKEFFIGSLGIIIKAILAII